MKSKLTITIKKRSQAGWLMWLIIVLPFLFGTLNEFLGIPWVIRYVLDVAWLGLLLLMCLNRAAGKTRKLMGWVIVFGVYTLLVYLARFQSPMYYLWGLRNNFRFYVAFFAFTFFLNSHEIGDYWKLLDAFFWIDIVVSIFQYLFLNLSGDQLGGLFGSETGCNAYTNIFFVIIVTKTVLFYLDNREKAISCICKCAAALLICAMAELKFFFIELVLILVLAVAFTNFTWKKIGLVLGGALAVVAGATLLTMIFPKFSGWFSWEWLLESAVSDMGYTSTGDLNRLTAISQINEYWLTSRGQRLFGLGLGNCDTSTFSFINTPFYENYGDMHYSWLSHAFMYLECGWIGLIFYFGFFVLAFFKISKIEKRSEGLSKIYCRISRIMAILCVIIAIYNASLRAETGYMAYFVLAIPFVLDREKLCRGE